MSFSQEIVYKQYSSENGLVSSYITQILQDDDGFIWLSTNNGISKFDGYTFKNFNTNDKLPENDIVGMYKTADNELWFLSRMGLLSYIDNDKIHLYPFNDKILVLLKEGDFIEPKSIIVTHNYIEFNVFERARYRIDSQGNIKKLYDVSDKQNIIDTRSKPLRYFINSQVQDFKLITLKDTSFVHIPMETYDEPTLCESINDTLFIANQNNLFVVKNGTVKTFSYNKAIISLQVDTKEDLWIGFKSGGVFCYKQSKLKAEADYLQLDGNSISSVIRDEQNSLWISSTNNGLFYLPSELFKQVTTKDGLLNNTLTQLDLSDNYLWAITGNNVISRLNYLGVKNYTFSNNIFSTATDIFWDNSKLWLSFKNKIMYLEKGKWVELLQLKNNSENHSFINRIDAGNNKDLWISKTNGFMQIRSNKVFFESSVQNHQNLNVNGIIAEPNGDLWLGCKNGLWRFHHNKLFNYNSNNNLLSKNIVDLVKDKKIGALWLAINGTGVVKILNDSIYLYSTNNGLISNSISSIYAAKNCVWVGTKEGISQILIESETKETITNITTKDGLISNEVNDIIANNKHVFIASNKGLCFFNYNKYFKNQEPLKVKISSIFVNAKPIKQASRIVINYNSNNIRINYKAIHFKSQGKINYRFRIKELENNNWIYTKSLNANYPFLPSGEYTFQIEAANENGVWSNRPTELKIIVTKPFWMEWWFLSIVIFMIFVIVYLLYRVLISARQKKERIKREINEYRQLALTRQMNPHFIFNSLNSIQHYILQNDTRLSNRFLSKFSKLIRLILENSQNSLISLEKELVALKLYLELESLRFKDKMQFFIDIDPEIDVLGVNIPPMLIQPFVENAIWHGIMNKNDGTTGLLRISFFIEKESITCTIHDNGVGRKKSAEINQKKNKTHTSMGTSITQDRVKLINTIYKKNITIKYEDPEDEYGNSVGTIVRIIFMSKQE